MSNAKYGELILDAIDQLRKRKARPDSERICHILQRRHGLKHSDVNEQLAKLVSEGVVIKVEYKGSTSYRNAAKWVRTRNPYFSGFADSPDVTSAALDAVDALPSTDDRSYRSSSIQDIEQYLLKKDSTQVNLNIASLKAKLEREVKRGALSQLPNGDCGSPQAKKRPKATNSTSSSETSESLQDSCCDYCLLGVTSNRRGVPEKLLICRDCNAKAHPSCMDYSEVLASQFDVTAWVCPDCKTCAVCLDPADTEELVICNTCDRGYHKICHTPVVESRPKGKWSCSRCVKLAQKNNSTSGKVSFNTDSCDSFTSEVEIPVDSDFVVKKCLGDYPSVVPLADDWTIREVEMFFRFIGYHAEAPAFREQEIDGQSLLLMKRSDVLTGLSIKLGPALKIYNHIKRLQTVQPCDVKKEVS